MTPAEVNDGAGALEPWTLCACGTVYIERGFLVVKAGGVVHRLDGPCYLAPFTPDEVNEADAHRAAVLNGNSASAPDEVNGDEAQQ